MLSKIFLVIAVLTAAITRTAASPADLKDLRPGFNLFSSQQDIEVGREAAAEVARQQPIVHDSELNNYLTSLVQRLARSPHAGTEFQFSVQAISDKNINAFALLGGPLFVYTGLISLADNEAQLAGGSLMSAAGQRNLKVNGYSALVTTLKARSVFQGETETDQLVTVLRPEGLWYLVFISPQSESRDIQPVFDQMLRSVRFSKSGAWPDSFVFTPAIGNHTKPH